MNQDVKKQFQTKAQAIGDRSRAVVLAELTHEGQVLIWTTGGPIDVHGLLGMVTTNLIMLTKANVKAERAPASPPPLPPMAENSMPATPPPPPSDEPQMSFPFANGDEA